MAASGGAGAGAAGGRLAGKVAIITGGASGMGKATALRFLAEGAQVLVADLNPDSGEAYLKDAAAAGFDHSATRFICVDVSEESDIEAMATSAVSAFGQLDVLFNNAGVGGAFGSVTELHTEDWDYTFAVLVRGVFLGIKHGARQMRAQGWGGSIINTASVAALSGGGGPLCYSAAKAGVLNLSKSAALELAPDRIRVNAICPGGILTPLFHRGREEAGAERLRSFQPWPDIGLPEHIAGAALFLASDDAAFVTGEHVVVDGGQTAAGPAMGLGGAASQAPAGFVGVNKGTTGEQAVIHQRPT
jgi:NAD(P)-dependent dehydrogenase (short-subunit alcohol dehydrogenase family)